MRIALKNTLTFCTICKLHLAYHVRIAATQFLRFKTNTPTTSHSSHANDSIQRCRFSKNRKSVQQFSFIINLSSADIKIKRLYLLLFATNAAYGWVFHLFGQKALGNETNAMIYYS